MDGTTYTRRGCFVLLCLTLSLFSPQALASEPSSPLDALPDTLEEDPLGHVLLEAAFHTERSGSTERSAALYATAAQHFPELKDVLTLHAASLSLRSGVGDNAHMEQVRELAPRELLVTPRPQFADIQLALFLELYATANLLPPAPLLDASVATHRETSCAALLESYHAEVLKLIEEMTPRPAHFGALVDTLHGHCEEHREDRSTPDELKLPVSASARTARAGLLIGHVHFRATLDEIARIDRKAQTPSERCATDFLKARATYRIKKTRRKAQALYEKVASSCTDPPEALTRRRSLYAMGKRAFDTGKLKESARHFTRILEDYPEASHADDAILYLARIAREQGDAAQERALVVRALSDYSSGDMLHEIVWEHVEAFAYEDAHSELLDTLDDLTLPSRDDQYYSQGRLRYFRARALAATKREPEAAALWRDTWMMYPFSFYGYLSHLRALKAGVDKSELALFPVVTGDSAQGTSSLPTKTLPLRDTTTSIKEEALWPLDTTWLRTPAGILTRHRLFELAARAEAAARAARREDNEATKGSRELWRAAWLYHQAGHYHVSHNIVRRQIPERPWRFPSSETVQRRAWALAWPAPYAEPVKEAVSLEAAQYSERGSDATLRAAFPLSIMREESSFIEDIVSYAGALGLMQLMLATARDHDEDVSPSPVTREALLTSKTNIRVGVDHLFTLAKRMGSHPVLMAASYNAGAGAVGSWLKSPRSREIALWTEDVPYFQARNYSKRVVGSYVAYQWLLGEEALDEKALAKAKKP